MYKRVLGLLLVFAGILISTFGVGYFRHFDKFSAIVLVSLFSLIVSALGVAIFMRAKYEGVLMSWSSLSLDVPYEINMFQSGKLLICINVAEDDFDYRFLSFVGVVPAGSTHLKIVKDNDNKLGIVFISLKPEETLITGVQEI